MKSRVGSGMMQCVLLLRTTTTASAARIYGHLRSLKGSYSVNIFLSYN